MALESLSEQQQQQRQYELKSGLHCTLIESRLLRAGAFEYHESFAGASSPFPPRSSPRRAPSSTDPRPSRKLEAVDAHGASTLDQEVTAGQLGITTRCIWLTMRVGWVTVGWREAFLPFLEGFELPLYFSPPPPQDDRISFYEKTELIRVLHRDTALLLNAIVVDMGDISGFTVVLSLAPRTTNT